MPLFHTLSANASWAIPPEPASGQHESHRQHQEGDKTMKLVGNDINKLTLVGNDINKLTPLEVSSVPLPFRLL